jgi:hypothetical protein
MSLHDDYARITPFELLFPKRVVAASLSDSIAEEAAGRGADDRSPDAFVTLGVVTDFVRSIEGADAPAGALVQYGALAYHAIHFLRAGARLYLLETSAARRLVERSSDHRPEPPAPAGYLQLPRHLFWLDGGDQVPESVDGVFWTIPDGERLHALVVAGLRADRSALRVVPLPQAPLGEASAWLDLAVRDDGADFSNDMPGAALEALLGFSTSGEVLKLLARFFAFASACPSALVPREAGGTGDPEPSALDYIRVTHEG